jgi:hypothetical protein
MHNRLPSCDSLLQATHDLTLPEAEFILHELSSSERTSSTYIMITFLQYADRSLPALRPFLRSVVLVLL